MTEKVLYIAAVLTKDSQIKLFELINSVTTIPEGWRKIGHHLTITFSNVRNAVEPGYFDESISWGMLVKLIPTHWKMDEKCIAVVVSTSPNASRLKIDNENPHITIAISKGTSPVYSNTLLGSGNLIPFEQQVHLDGHLLKVLPGGHVSPQVGDLADETFIG